jgi:hypothetical protein
LHRAVAVTLGLADSLPRVQYDVYNFSAGAVRGVTPWIRENEERDRILRSGFWRWQGTRRVVAPVVEPRRTPVLL